MWNKRFEGWYLKHQLGDDMISFIPGRAQSGAFIQVITADGSRQFDVPELFAENEVIRAGNCRFSRKGCKIDLPGVQGEIRYGPFMPLASDIMGPFRFLPMECRHGIISMSHPLTGELFLDGVRHGFDGGVGYIEKDSGASFPRSYLWLQCSDFPTPCSLMVSVARIPLWGMAFPGCICCVVLPGREYRLATYRGVRIRAANTAEICLSQGRVLLQIELQAVPGGHALRAPQLGAMSKSIRESINAAISVRLWDHGRLIFEGSSRHAACEFVGEPFPSRPAQ